MIPKIIHQTFETKFTPPGMSRARGSWSANNPEYVYKFYEATDRIDFIKNNFPVSVLKAYHDIIPGAFKADLFRYCVLYIEGGVYADSDTTCLTPLDEYINKDTSLLVVRDDPMAKKWLANAFIATKAGEGIFLDAINRCVENIKSRKEMFYLDYTGPGLLGKCVNRRLNREIETEYELGSQDVNGLKFKILKHDFTSTEFKYNDKPVIHVEYPTYREEMKELNNKPFYHYVQNNIIFKKIPNKIIYTTYDALDVNSYMVDSFTKLNPEYDLVYFNQQKVDEWFKKSIYNEAYLKLKERGEKSDFFRYCYLWENGGVYVDADIYCNQPLRNWINHQDLIVGLEAETDSEDPMFKGIGIKVGNKMLSVCNWAIASAPKQQPIGRLIDDIINNPTSGVLQNTGPRRFTKHIINYFGDKRSIDNCMLLPINALGSNQSHSGSFKSNRPFEVDREDVYLTHMFAGSWRGNQKRKSINLIPKEVKPSVSHNITISKDKDGYIGVARYDVDTARTEFMKKLGSSTSLLEYKFDKRFNVVSKEIKNIQGANQSYKFEDYREFKHKGTSYYCVAYLDKKFNTYMGVLDSEYNFLGRINIDRNHKMSFGIGGVVAWEKNWLFFEKENELYFIYSTTPNLIIYKCKDFNSLSFQVYSNTPNVYESALPKDQLYFSSNTSTGGSTNPIYDSQNNCYVYLIHTKIYKERGYNHFAVSLDKDLNIMNINPIPFIGYKIGYALMFITTMIENKDHYVICGGIEDNQNFIWEIPKSRLSI